MSVTATEPSSIVSAGRLVPRCASRKRSASTREISRSRARASLDDGAVDLPGQDRRHGARAIRVRKHVEVRQRRLLEICGEHLEVLVGLAGKADDDVRSDRRVGQALANGVDQRAVVLDGV